MVTALYVVAGLSTFLGLGLGLASLAHARHLRTSALRMRPRLPTTRIADAARGATVHVVGTVVPPAEQSVPSTGQPASLVLEVLLLSQDNVGFSSTKLRHDRHGDSFAIEDGTGTALLDVRNVTLLARSSEHRGPASSLPPSGRAMVTRTTAKPDAPYVYQQHWVCPGDHVEVEGIVMDAAGPAGGYRDPSVPRITLAGTETSPLRITSRDLDAMSRASSATMLFGLVALAAGPVLFLVAWLASD